MDLSHLAEWLIKNTKHPKDPNLPWSFKDHEFQIDILNDDAAWVVVRKCSQVGVSELTVRMILAMLAVLRNHTAIYTLPTAGFATKFAKSRFDPVVDDSRVLKELIDPDTDSSALKKIGSNFLYILGTYTQGSAISIPADILVHDEVDFSDQQALTTFASRLGHAKNGGIRREFSTPTVNGFGISKTFEASSQNYRGVVCDNCHETVFPEFFQDVIVPGFEEELEKLERDDLNDPRYDFKNAFLSCPKCHQELKLNNLKDPEKRIWVPKHLGRDIHGYQVYPWDVSAINPVSRTLQQLSEYEKKADWVNFKIGLPFEDAESSFLREIMEANKIVGPRNPPPEEQQDAIDKFDFPKGLVMGVDVGKVSNVLVGQPIGRNKLDIIWAERVRQTGDGALLKRLVFLTKWFGISKAVIDAGPDFTTAMAFVEAFMMGRVFANYYTRARSKNTLSHLQINEEEGIVTSVRTESFDLLAKKVNGGHIRFPKTAETPLVIDHLDYLKRVETQNNQGDLVANWTATGPDHYGHALNYCNIAANLLDDRFAVSSAVGALPMATAVRLKTPT